MITAAREPGARWIMVPDWEKNAILVSGLLPQLRTDGDAPRTRTGRAARLVGESLDSVRRRYSGDRENEGTDEKATRSSNERRPLITDVVTDGLDLHQVMLAQPVPAD